MPTYIWVCHIFLGWTYCLPGAAGEMRQVWLSLSLAVKWNLAFCWNLFSSFTGCYFNKSKTTPVQVFQLKEVISIEDNKTRLIKKNNLLLQAIYCLNSPDCGGLYPQKLKCSSVCSVFKHSVVSWEPNTVHGPNRAKSDDLMADCVFTGCCVRWAWGGVVQWHHGWWSSGGQKRSLFHSSTDHEARTLLLKLHGCSEMWAPWVNTCPHNKRTRSSELVCCPVMCWIFWNHIL